jgi:hydrogenase maturation protein HypF
VIRVAITARGVVQGVGFRPFVDRAARSFGLAGWVRNEPAAVHIEAQGTAAAVRAFVDALLREAPAPARIDGLDVVEIAPVERSRTGQEFEIRDSTLTGPVAATLTPDLAICAECSREIASPAARRYRYPFTNCSACGPRFTIVEAMPYDRARTSMRAFAMCDACAAEYRDERDRRYHAEPIACPACGPELVFRDVSCADIVRGDNALHTATETLRRGEILALLGIGGFQLLADATDERAVSRLRARKHRPRKPFAVMFSDTGGLLRHAAATPEELDLLRSPRAPIVIVRAGAEPLAPSVAPRSRWIGAMLPYSPLHRLLLDEVARPLVCTSGNVAEEPLCIDMEDASKRLENVPDAYLVHERRVVRPLDDSVARIAAGRPRLLRRARGYAPELLKLERSGPTVLALGGDGKAAVTLAKANTAVVGPHVGDLATIEGLRALERSAHDLAAFLDARIERVACDLHPDYASTRLAERVAAALGAPLVRVQHHHAHVAACIAEHGIEGPVLGFAWDGAGLGRDGMTWGGEALVCQGESCNRVAHLRPFALPGGDRAARSPRRIALALAVDALGAEAALSLAETWFPAGGSDAASLVRMIERGVHAPMTTSVGRLFDGVSCIAGLLDESTFEAEAGIAVEQAAERWLASGEAVKPWPLPIDDAQPAVADLRALLRAALADRDAGLPADAIALKLHETLAELAVAIAERVGIRSIVLSGGCFQNGILLSAVNARLQRAGYEVFVPERFPPNDGGLSLGQAWVAREGRDVLGDSR